MPRLRGSNSIPTGHNEDNNGMVSRKGKHLHDNDTNTTEMVETNVVYPPAILSSESATKSASKPQMNEEEESYSSIIDMETATSTFPSTKLKRISNTNLSSTSVPSECPSLFFPSSKMSSSQSFSSSDLPTFPQRLKCNTMISISNHPSLYFTSFITTLFIFYCSCCRRSHRRGRRSNGSGSARGMGMFWRNRKDLDTKNKGEYTALETVYDELLDDFDDEDLSSYMQEDGDDDSDDSIGTIISQYSDKVGIGNGTSGSGKGGKIELTSFDDGHLSLREVNG